MMTPRPMTARGVTVAPAEIIDPSPIVALGATVVSAMTVGARTIVGAGAVVVTNIPDDVVAFGVPARIRPDRKP